LDNAVVFYQTMCAIADELLEHGYKTFKENFANPDRFGAYPELISQFESELGALQSVVYLGAMPFRGYIIATLRLFFEKENRVLSLAWSDGKIAGRFPYYQDKASVIECVAFPQDEQTIAGHDLLSGTSFTLTFADDGATLSTNHVQIHLKKR
jgi:hypothetical protein